MSNLDFIKKLYKGKNCYSDHMESSDIENLHIPSHVETLILELIEKNKIVFLTGNPGDGKTYAIKAIENKIKDVDVYIETDLNRIANYEEVANNIYQCYENNIPAVIAANEFPFVQLSKIFRDKNPKIFEEINQVKHESIIYGVPSYSINRIIIIDLNERNLLDKDRELSKETLNRICDLLNEKQVNDKSLKYNLQAMSEESIKYQVLTLLNYATSTHEHFAIRDILGAFSFMLTACTLDQYRDLLYYDALFESDNQLLEVVRSFDPIYLSDPSLDEMLWNGEVLDGWLLGAPDKWPNNAEFDNDIEEAIACFKTVKRKYYFENVEGHALESLRPKEVTQVYEIFTSFESQKKKIKEKIVKSINKLFLPSSEEKKQLRIWTTHRFDLSMEASTAVSSKYIDSSALDILMPRPADWLSGLEYTPSHIILKPKEAKSPRLILDVDFLRTLEAIENGYPIGLLSSRYEQAAASFLKQLDDNNLTEDNEDGEIIIASRKKNYKRSIFIQDGKYNFEGDDE